MSIFARGFGITSAYDKYQVQNIVYSSLVHVINKYGWKSESQIMRSFKAYDLILVVSAEYISHRIRLTFPCIDWTMK